MDRQIGRQLIERQMVGRIDKLIYRWKQMGQIYAKTDRKTDRQTE